MTPGRWDGGEPSSVSRFLFQIMIVNGWNW